MLSLNAPARKPESPTRTASLGRQGSEYRFTRHTRNCGQMRTRFLGGRQHFPFDDDVSTHVIPRFIPDRGGRGCAFVGRDLSLLDPERRKDEFPGFRIQALHNDGVVVRGRAFCAKADAVGGQTLVLYGRRIDLILSRRASAVSKDGRRYSLGGENFALRYAASPLLRVRRSGG